KPGTLATLDKDELVVATRRLLAKSNAFASRVVAVNEIGVAMSHRLEVEDILQNFAQRVKWVMDFEHCSICLRDDADTWALRTLFGIEQMYTSPMLTASENIGVVLRHGHAKMLDNIQTSHVLSDYCSQLIIPLHDNGEVIATINFASVAEDVYINDDLRIGYLLSLQLAAALRNAWQFAELSRTRAELQTYTDRLEVRNQELDAYAHTIAHDLKSPLNAIMLKSSLLKRIYQKKLPESVRHLDDINAVTHKMTDMVEQLLWLAKVRDVNEHLETVNMQTVAGAAAGRFAAECEVKAVEIHIDETLPDVWGLSQWLEEVFANFISNAIKYRKPENDEHHIYIEHENAGEMIRFNVRDNGIGIPPEKQQSLFEMFTRLHAVDAEGLGLGLSIVHRVVKNLGGEVGVESVPGEGSTFYFTMPPVPEGDSAPVPK
ncbi:MAG: sensor histidine kinase, partial [Aggregatilineales bacterium]